MENIRYNLTRMKNRNKQNRANKMNRENKKNMIKQVKIANIISIFVIFLASFSLNTAEAEETLKYTVRHEVIQSNGVLASQPRKADRAIDFIIKTNKISSLEDYSKWLKANIRYNEDGSDDVWADPEETIKRRKGDCEDFTLLTAEVLRGLGYKPHFLALVREGEAHAICVFKKDGVYMWFDNTTLKTSEARTLRDFAREVINKYKFLKMAELNQHDYSWKTVYKKS